jgi:oligopeptide/dipeptide ABC transporter ATP-binding protein
MADTALLRVRDLVTSVPTQQGATRVVDGVSFDVGRAATVALVGESGCGKTVTALSILRLVASPGGRIESGTVELDGVDLLRLTEREMRGVRGRAVAMVFQEPMTSLHPCHTVGWQVRESLTVHRRMSRGQARARAVELFDRVGLPEPSTIYATYPHRLSAGQRQRAMIAMALAGEPKLLVMDDPTSALDVNTQSQVLEYLGDLQESTSMSILLITHDLRIVAEHASDVVVMYAGRVVESASAPDLLARQRHPYTRGMMECVPRLGSLSHRRLLAIEGVAPVLDHVGPGCRFAERCPMRVDRCAQEEPELAAVGPGRWARCWRHDEVPS